MASGTYLLIVVLVDDIVVVMGLGFVIVVLHTFETRRGKKLSIAKLEAF